FDEKAARKFLTAETLALVAALTARLEALPEWAPAEIERAFQATLESTGKALGFLAQPVRVALTGSTVSPGIFDVLAVLGREPSLRRLRAVLDRGPVSGA